MPGCAKCLTLLLDDPTQRVVPWDHYNAYIEHMNEVHGAKFTKAKKEGPGFERWQPHEAPNGRSKK